MKHELIRDAFTEVLIIGAGFGGLGMAVALQRAGITFQIVEKSTDVGGTWRENVYPGAGCDIVSHLYSFSFFQKANWSKRFALQNEIQDYMRHMAQRFSLYPHINFSTEVKSSTFDETERVWNVVLSNGMTKRARFLVAAVGQLNRPFTPAFEGREQFTGKAFHSAEWDNSVELSGKKVAVIGSGASAIQFVPRITPKVGKLTLFQRSPNWVIPKDDRVVSGFESAIYRTLPGALAFRRLVDYWTLERTFSAFLKASRYGRRWEKQSLDAMKAHVKDPALQRILTPDYPAGCKRILLSNEWYQTLARSNVRVVPQAVVRFEKRDVIDGSGESHEADVVIFATGFKSQEFLAPMDIYGRDGKSLAEAWRPYPVTHLGMTTPGFPNFFMIYGPNSNLGHGSALFMHECQINYIRACISHTVKSDMGVIEPTAVATQRSYGKMDSAMEDTVWSAGCSSWYKTADGKIVNNWSGNTLQYWWETRRPKFDEFAFEPKGALYAKV